MQINARFILERYLSLPPQNPVGFSCQTTDVHCISKVAVEHAFSFNTQSKAVLCFCLRCVCVFQVSWELFCYAVTRCCQWIKSNNSGHSFNRYHLATSFPPPAILKNSIVVRWVWWLKWWYNLKILHQINKFWIIIQGWLWWTSEAAQMSVNTYLIIPWLQSFWFISSASVILWDSYLHKHCW